MTRTFRIVKIWCGDEGALPPATPVNPYLGRNARKKCITFFKPNHFRTFLKLHFWAKTGPRGSPEAKYELGGPWERSTPIGIEGVKQNTGSDQIIYENGEK